MSMRRAWVQLEFCMKVSHIVEILRLRAAVFCNLVDMREAISIDKHGNQHATLSDANIRKLQQANLLFHAALNSPIPSFLN